MITNAELQDWKRIAEQGNAVRVAPGTLLKFLKCIEKTTEENEKLKAMPFKAGVDLVEKIVNEWIWTNEELPSDYYSGASDLAIKIKTALRQLFEAEKKL